VQQKACELNFSSVHKPSVSLPQEFGTPYCLLFVTASHSLLLDVTSRLTVSIGFYCDRVANTPIFSLESFNYLLTYLTLNLSNWLSR